VASAKAKAERVKEEAKAEAEEHAATLRFNYKGTLKEIADKSDKEFRESVSEIKLRSGKKLEEAAELVIKKLIS
jgi:F0F1-type ATP synthase membrane subunit b/b'